MSKGRWIVLVTAGWLLGCSSEKQGVTQNPEGTPDPSLGTDASLDSVPNRCDGMTTVPLNHRAESVACAPSPGASSVPDGGLTDQCLADNDCGTGAICGCADQFGGNYIHTNRCVPADCRVDNDCGPGGLCSPDQTGRCGSILGMHCRSAADECAGSADCCADPTRPMCGYSPELGHWTCQAITVCNG